MSLDQDLENFGEIEISQTIDFAEISKKFNLFFTFI